MSYAPSSSVRAVLYIASHSIACSGDYPETLVQQAWKIVLRELRKEGARQLAGALAACNAGDVHLILRHLAICHVSAW